MTALNREAAAARARQSDDQALIAHLKLQIEKLNRDRHGPRSECQSALDWGSDSYVERPGLQDLFLVEQGMTVRSYVRPVNAAPGRWPR